MRYLMLLALFCVGVAQAGGIAFEEKYVGKHPITGTKITLEVKDRKVSFSVEDSIGAAQDLRMVPVSRTNLETIFNLVTGEEDEKGEVVARIVTTGDCQIVKSLALVYLSGLTAPLKAVARK